MREKNEAAVYWASALQMRNELDEGIRFFQTRKHLIYQENIKTLLNYQQKPRTIQRADLRE